MEHCLIFSPEIFYVTIGLSLNILRLKAVNEITPRQTRTKDVREPASSYYAGSHRTGHRLAMGSKMAVCLRLFDIGADSIPSNLSTSFTLTAIFGNFGFVVNRGRKF